MFDTMFVQALVSKGKESKISAAEYSKWQKHFSFDALKGKHYGQSFSEYFNITDYRIRFERDWKRCDALIKREWITNHAPCGI